jgi:hypothetical protein
LLTDEDGLRRAQVQPPARLLPFVRLQTEDTPTAYSRAAELGMFDAAEHRFMQLYDQRTIADGLLDWLSSRIDQVAQAIGVPTGSNTPPP